MVIVAIEYTNGDVLEFTADRWPHVRSDGVYTVSIRDEVGVTTFHGRSAYWMYREDGMWVAGAASFGYDLEIPPEILFYDDGTQDYRRIQYVPDLEHLSLKLGWWR